MMKWQGNLNTFNVVIQSCLEFRFQIIIDLNTPYVKVQW